MILRKIRFDDAFDQSGLRNFDALGYPYHRFFKGGGLTFNHCTFVAKTTTLLPRVGNMPLKPDGMTPAQLRPKCIHVSVRSFLHGAAINAVGLSGPGLAALLAQGVWDHYPRPFMISVMSVAPSLDERLAEISKIRQMLTAHPKFQSPFGIQLNMSCPNVEHEQQVEAVVVETRRCLAILRKLGDVPLVVKINTLFPIEAALEICKDPNCDAQCNSNTLPWKDLPVEQRLLLFGCQESPLSQFGGGGVSGAYLLPLVMEWVHKARQAGLRKPIIAGGGILKPVDVEQLADVGASAVAIGSVAFLRPWRVQRIINRANELGQWGAFRY